MAAQEEKSENHYFFSNSESGGHKHAKFHGNQSNTKYNIL